MNTKRFLDVVAAIFFTGMFILALVGPAGCGPSDPDDTGDDTEQQDAGGSNETDASEGDAAVPCTSLDNIPAGFEDGKLIVCYSPNITCYIKWDKQRCLGTCSTDPYGTGEDLLITIPEFYFSQCRPHGTY